MKSSRHLKVSRKTPAEIELMRRAGEALARTLERLNQEMRPGVTTAYLDAVAEETIRSAGAIPSFKGYNGYPATICVEVEDVVVHGIPRPDEPLREGTVVGIDVGCALDGWHADAAFTVAIGKVDDLRQRLIEVTKRSLEVAIEHARPGARLEEISRAVQCLVETHGFSVIRSLVGHGIGRQLHEPPQVPNFYEPGAFSDYDIVLRPGMTLAIEPMVAAGTWEVRVDEDGWTTRTADGMPSAHFEHTVAITKNGPVVLTAMDVGGQSRGAREKT